MPQFDPNFVAAYLADNESSDSKNMTEFEKADGFEQISEKNMANYEDQSTEKNLASFEAAAEEWDAVAEVEATFGEGKKEKVAVVAAPIVTMEKILDHLQEAWIEDYLAQVRFGTTKKKVELLFVKENFTSAANIKSHLQPWSWQVGVYDMSWDFVSD